MMWRYKILVFSFALASIIGCTSQKQTQSSQLKNAYEENITTIAVDCILFHYTSDSSRLYVRTHTQNLLYARQGNAKPTASVVVKVKKPNGDKPIKTFRITDTDPDKIAKTLIAHTDLHLPKGERTQLIITVTDENRSRTVEKRITSNKTDLNNRQNFLITDVNQQVPIFTDRVKPNADYRIFFNEEIKNQLVSRFYSRDFSMPAPPFVMYARKPFDYDADAIQKLPLQDSNHFKFTTGNNGFYHITLGEESEEGLTLFISDPDFPKVTTEEDLMWPLRYILSGKEFDRILSAPDRKQALENMWISWAGSKDRARKSIKAYYNRVERANEYFSSHVEGWKSDRGMIYIVYGKPNKIYRTDEVETWIYGDEGSPLAITFYFLKVVNPFTDNDYILNREEIYKPSWYRMANAWRDGRIF